jgi:hypothetical protein
MTSYPDMSTSAPELPDVSWRPDVAKESAGFTDDNQRMLASKLLAGWPSIQRKIGTNDWVPCGQGFVHVVMPAYLP